MRPIHRFVRFDATTFRRDVDALLHTGSSHHIPHYFARAGRSQSHYHQVNLVYLRCISLMTCGCGSSYDTFGDSTIFNYDYEAMRDAMQPFRDELLRHVMHPRNVARIAGIM
jgi:hypothetical protein